MRHATGIKDLAFLFSYVILLCKEADAAKKSQNARKNDTAAHKAQMRRKGGGKASEDCLKIAHHCPVGLQKRSDALLGCYRIDALCRTDTKHITGTK